MKTSRFKALAAVLLILGIACFSGPAGATIHNLAAEFSTISNPFDGWSLYDGSYNLMNTVRWWTGDSPGVLAWDYNSSFSPIWFNQTLPVLDLLPGEVATYADGGSKVVWTSDVTGTLEVYGSVWSPRQNPPYGRSGDWDLYVNSTRYAGGHLTDTINNRNNRETFDTGVLAIQAGQTVVMDFYTDYIGVDLTIDAAPLPAAVWLLGSGLGLLAWGWRRRPS